MRLATALAGIAMFVTLAAVGGGLALYKKSQIEASRNTPPMPEFGEAARVAPAREIQWQPISELVGTAFSLRSVRVSNELAGVIREIRFTSGSVVEAGEVLLSLNDATERADLAAAGALVHVNEANVAVGQSRLRLAEIELAAVKEASTQGAATPIEVDRRLAELRTAQADIERLQAEVDQARAMVDQMKVSVEKHVIRAPFRGRTGIRTVHEGQYLAEGTNVATFEEIADRIYLDFAIPQEYLTRVKLGLIVMATSPVLGPEPIGIEVVAIDATVSNSTRNVRVRGIVDNPSVNGEQRIRPGMFVQVRVPVDPPSPRVVVPATAVRRATHGDHVWIVAPSDQPGDAPGTMRAKQRPVKLGSAVDEDVIVLEGVTVGEMVATSGSFKLREGVMVMNPDAMPPPATAGH